MSSSQGSSALPPTPTGRQFPGLQGFLVSQQQRVAELADDSGATASKAKRNKKRKNNSKPKTNGLPIEADKEDHEGEIEGQEESSEPSASDLIDAPNSGSNNNHDEPKAPESNAPKPNAPEPDQSRESDGMVIASNSSQKLEQTSNGVQSTPPTPTTASNMADTSQRLDALVKDRDNLRVEVSGLRKSLEEIQAKHEAEVEDLREQLENTESGKDHAENQYRNLLGKVNSIKSSLGERLKADAEEMEQARTRIDELEEENAQIKEILEARAEQITQLGEENEQHSKELSSLRNRTNLSSQNWAKERDDFIDRETYLREEYEASKQAMHDWEVLAMEERTIRTNLTEKAAELEEQVSTLQASYEKAALDRDTLTNTVEGLQRALRELQDERAKQLRELVENYESQITELTNKNTDSEKRVKESNAALENFKNDLERVLPFEKEVKEKNLQIGKLRHEAVILNDHLTKALRFLKKGKPEDNVDRQIVTNHLLHFLALDRSDPKKFQILQLIAALLGWTEEQREQAGLARPGAAIGSIRGSTSPFHRAPSTPTLSSDFSTDNSSTRESLAELWSTFLERESREGGKTSRSGSMASGSRA
ncbi:MAG: hypothetical protein M1834_004511 [Cirrosporium novae-zelandiae]|nr:MAG: hypothetical protein M1834_004511 [Cirrosporium novae-zelandiae]